MKERIIILTSRTVHPRMG